MQWINCLFILFVAEIFSASQTTETPGTPIVNQQIKLLNAKMDRLRNLSGLIKNSTLFRNWEGTCPLDFDGQLDCKIVVVETNKKCLCWNAKKEKVNWFTADAFCDYHGMHLISFPLNIKTDQTIFDLINSGIWTSANDFITRRVWMFRNGVVLSQENAYKMRSHKGLDQKTLNRLAPLNENSTSTWTQPTTCISSSLKNNTIKFFPKSCLELNLFICQQFIS